MAWAGTVVTVEPVEPVVFVVFVVLVLVDAVVGTVVVARTVNVVSGEAAVTGTAAWLLGGNWVEICSSRPGSR